MNVKVLKLPDLPDKGDVYDFIEQRRSEGRSSAEIREEIERLAAATDPIEPAPPPARIDDYEPFPVDALPEPARRYVKVVSRAIGCLPAYVVLPLLAVLGAAIGNSRRLQLKPGWDVPPIIWALVISESGTAKSPAFRTVLQPVYKRQTREFEKHAANMKRHEMDLARWEKEFSEWRRLKNVNYDPPVKPEEPYPQRYVVNDTTVEAIVQVLFHVLRGLLLACDELAGWFGSFNKYSKGGGNSDEAQYLQMHNGDAVCVDRKTGNPPVIHVERASLCIAGVTQPGVAKRVLNVPHRESGLTARFLMAWPPRRAKQWTDSSINPEVVQDFANLLGQLYELGMDADELGRLTPVILNLTSEAKSRYVAFYDEHNRQISSLDSELAAAWSKLEEYAARLALIVHLVRATSNDPTLSSHDEVDAQSMESGIAIARWFGGEAKRVYALLTESDDEQRDRELLDWITRRGGSVTAREVQQGLRQYKSAEAAEKALQRLAVANYGVWRPVPSGSNGGRPTQRFVLHSVNETQLSDGKCVGFVDVDNSYQLQEFTNAD